MRHDGSEDAVQKEAEGGETSKRVEDDQRKSHELDKLEKKRRRRDSCKGSHDDRTEAVVVGDTIREEEAATTASAEQISEKNKRKRKRDERPDETSQKRRNQQKSRIEPPTLKLTVTNQIPHANCFNKKILFGKVVTYSWFKSAGFHFKRLFRKLGWKNFVGLEEPQYTDLVREFYKNLKLKSKGSSLSTSVMGKTISFNADNLAQIYNIRRGEFDAVESKTWIKFDGFIKKDVIKQICLAGKAGKGALKARNLTLQARLLHFIICTNLVPRLGSKDHVTNSDVFMVWCILNGKRLDLPNIIMRNMWNSATKAKGGLPYGMALTPLFRANGLLENTDGLEMVESKDHMYSATTLFQMGYIRTNEGDYVKKSNVEGNRREERGDNTDSEQTNDLNVENIESLRNDFNQLTDVVNQRIDRLEEMVRAGLDELKTFVTKSGKGKH